MVIKSWLSFFAVMIFFPLFIAYVNIEAFFIIMSVFIFTISAKSFKNLLILNWGSDSMYNNLENQLASNAKHKQSRSNVLNKTIIVCLNLMVIIFFLYAFNITDCLALRILSVVVTSGWVIDFGKTILNILNPPLVDSDHSPWTWKDTLAEGIVWVHNILTIGLIISLFIARYYVS